ncbi:basic salivary proline-rich protein 1-like [Eublepharis macularius]|uniref:Basic salivary proline-rich protein 1-like n=1 Tax=Eublepharis macularius TaxID=481883 RepID=A0AA97LJW9_EUBMA|nr:basic salivary proline-rich protein 1-like [Eublepharis macularius]
MDSMALHPAEVLRLPKFHPQYGGDKLERGQPHPTAGQAGRLQEGRSAPPPRPGFQPGHGQGRCPVQRAASAQATSAEAPKATPGQKAQDPAWEGPKRPGGPARPLPCPGAPAGTSTRIQPPPPASRGSPGPGDPRPPCPAHEQEPPTRSQSGAEAAGPAQGPDPPGEPLPPLGERTRHVRETLRGVPRESRGQSAAAFSARALPGRDAEYLRRSPQRGPIPGAAALAQRSRVPQRSSATAPRQARPIALALPGWEGPAAAGDSEAAAGSSQPGRGRSASGEAGPGEGGQSRAGRSAHAPTPPRPCRPAGQSAASRLLAPDRPQARAGLAGPPRRVALALGAPSRSPARRRQQQLLPGSLRGLQATPRSGGRSRKLRAEGGSLGARGSSGPQAEGGLGKAARRGSRGAACAAPARGPAQARSRTLVGKRLGQGRPPPRAGPFQRRRRPAH